MSKFIFFTLLFFVCPHFLVQAEQILPQVSTLVSPVELKDPIDDYTDIQFKSVGNFCLSLGSMEKTDSTKVQIIEIKNGGGNLVLPESLYYSSRTWEFSTSDGTAQDLGLYITDEPTDGVASHQQDSWMGFYPRRNLLAYRLEGNQVKVTLPNGEPVIFDATTGVILDGVLRESAPLSKGTRSLSPPQVAYTGQGVMIRADSVANSPQQNGLAIITKGSKTCRVQKSQLWPDISQSSAMHFKFLNDVDLDQFLRLNCHFGLDL